MAKTLKVKVGDRIVFGRGKINRNENLEDITIGKIYVVAGVNERSDDAPYFIDDVGDKNCAGFNTDTHFGKATKIVD